MKKKYTYLLIITTLLSIVCCNQEEEPSLSHEENIIGVWEESAKIKNGEDTFHCPSIFTFKVNTFKWEEHYDSGCSKYDSDNNAEPYSIDENILTVEDLGDTYTFKILSLDATNMKLEYTFNGEDILVSSYQKR